MVLPTERTTSSSDIRDYILLAHGVPKVGKTTFFSRLEKALFLLTNPAPEALSLYAAPVRSWTEFLQVGHALEKEEHDFDVVVIDTIETLYSFCSAHVLAQVNAQTSETIIHESDLEWGKGWHLVEAEFHRKLARLCNNDFGVVFVSHTELKEIKLESGAKRAKYVPRLNKQAYRVVNSLVSHILYFEITENRDGKPVRQIRTKASPLWEAGVRTDDGVEMPDPLPMDPDAFMAAFEETFGKEKDNDD